MLVSQSFRRAVQIGGRRIATIDGHERRSWEEVSGRVRRLSGSLGSLGIASGDRVAILASNSARYLETYFALFAVGAVCVPLNTRWSFDELAYGIADSGAVAVFADVTFLDTAMKLRRETDTLRQVVAMTDEPTRHADVACYEDLLRSGEPTDAMSLPADQLAMICYTGGTTGKSKGVMLSHLALWSSGLAYGHDVHDLASERTINLNIMPLFHIGGFEPMLATVMGAGCNVFLPSFEPRTLLQTLQDERVTYVLLVPTMVRALLDQPDLASFDLSAIRLIGYGAAPMSQAQIEETMRKLPGINLLQGYGQTELAPYIAALKPEDHRPDGPYAARLRSAGKASIGCEVIIADPDGKEVPRGTLGEILVRGPNMMLGYWRKPEETAAALVDGWVRTGDAGYMDEDGFIFIIDRLKDMIVSGGENIYSTEVENAVASHPAVATCIVIGVPHERWGEAVHAIVVLREGHDVLAEELIDHCRRQIAGYKCPRSVEFRTEPLPVSGAGKILKRELRKPYWEGRASAVV